VRCLSSGTETVAALFTRAVLYAALYFGPTCELVLQLPVQHNCNNPLQDPLHPVPLQFAGSQGHGDEMDNVFFDVLVL